MTVSINEKRHTFHIPVMGTGFTIDTPLKVAKYGISSVISLLDDVLIEQMRKFHSEVERIPYKEIKKSSTDSRARRITAYLNLLDKIINRQINELKKSPFTDGSEITRYFNLLPQGDLRNEYDRMLQDADPEKKKRMQKILKDQVVPGSIDVNIMTKCDRDNFKHGKKLAPHFADAMSALRGFAKSSVSSSIVFSAGMNPRLFTYAGEFPDFFPDENGNSKKKIVLKVSDYRSATIQGKFLAKRGLWVSEYRVESGLNCGGHAFSGKGHLMGVTLEEFAEKREELTQLLYELYSKALASKGLIAPKTPPISIITAQGGIGTFEENELLLNHYGVDGTGWGTPFMLVPEVVNVDDSHLKKLLKAKKNDVYLSDSSPLNVPFWNLRKSASEKARRLRIKKGIPGSQCPKGFPAFNQEFTSVPICTASRLYQKLKLADLKAKGAPKKQILKALINGILHKSCLCNDLAGAVIIKTGIDTNVTPAITTGPNIINFTKIASLEKMVNHIYGRIPISIKRKRQHMFITELALNIEKLKKDLKQYKKGLLPEAQKLIAEQRENLIEGIRYYKKFARKCLDKNKKQFLADLEKLENELNAIMLPNPA